MLAPTGTRKPLAVLRQSSGCRTGIVRPIRSLHGSIPARLFRPDVHTEAVKIVLSSKKLGTVVETGYCDQNTQFIPGTSSLGVRMSKGQESSRITVVRAKSLGRKQKCLISCLPVL